MTEREKRMAWNASMLKTARQCSLVAARWIMAKIEENKAIISMLPE